MTSRLTSSRFYTTLASSEAVYRIVDLPSAAGEALPRLPWVHRIFLENLLRKGDLSEAQEGRAAILDWLVRGTSEAEIAFYPNRVLMHDTTCVPALVDIAAMRQALAEAGIDPTVLNPSLPVDVSVDHSVAVDDFGRPDALERNMSQEILRNTARYRLMKWASQAFDNVRIFPPGTGIMHTINLERLATVVSQTVQDGMTWAVPDTLIGTDSHTPMVNGIGVLGWGVGGIEAEGVLFDIPLTLRIPDVVGVRLAGALHDAFATDLALYVTERLRQLNLSGQFVEFFGPGVSALSAGERAVVANMAPEYGASCGYFPIDRRTCDYLRSTGREERQASLVSDFAHRTGLWFDPGANPRYTDIVEIDLNQVEMSISGPRRPQDRRPPGKTVSAFDPPLQKTIGQSPPDGVVAIAAIASCTNTSDPRLLIAAGLVAQKARRLGLKPPPWVKTSLAPGSPTAIRYLERAGLREDLSALGFDIVGFGCTTCIGNSGALTPEVATALKKGHARAVAVLSGNRNFPGRVHPDLEYAFLASPPLVVAFALAGDVARDIVTDPLGRSADGAPVHLRDLWPSGQEIDKALATALATEDYDSAYAHAEASEVWARLEAPATALFPWADNSTYIRRPPFAALDGSLEQGWMAAHPLLVLGDDITTDHISPAGQIQSGSSAAEYLVEQGEDRAGLNVFAARRGNWEVMVRGLFTNRSVRNLLATNTAAGTTIHVPSGDVLPLWQVAERYRREGRPVVIVAGERYGTGSSRDWAAKGLSLLGVRAVLAASFERIHRSNLIGMGILPLRLPKTCHPEIVALRPGDQIELDMSFDNMKPRGLVPVTIRRQGGTVISFESIAAVETALELDLLREGGMIPSILKRAQARAQKAASLAT